MSGEIPQSKALVEAGVDSLSDLFSRDPEGYSQQDMARLVAELRKQREAWAKAEALGKKSAPKAGNLLKQVATQSAEDMGL